MKKSQLKKYIKSSLVNEARVYPDNPRVSPDNRVEYLVQTLDHVWNMGTGNNKVNFESIAQSIINDIFGEESLDEDQTTDKAAADAKKRAIDAEIKALQAKKSELSKPASVSPLAEDFGPAVQSTDPKVRAIEDKINKDPKFLEKTKDAMEKAKKGDATDLALMMASFGKMFESEEEEEGVDTSMDKVAKALSAVQKKLDQMFADFKMGKMNKDEYMSKRKELQAKRDKLNAALISFEEDEDEI